MEVYYKYKTLLGFNYLHSTYNYQYFGRMMACFKFLMCLILVLLSSARIESRSLKPIGIAREAFEFQFKTMETNDKSKYEQPQRVSPGGPDPFHHFRHY
ncbi:hypothetical protein ACSBR2_014515 [Camellia fascicularis]